MNVRIACSLVAAALAAPSLAGAEEASPPPPPPIAPSPAAVEVPRPPPPAAVEPPKPPPPAPAAAVEVPGTAAPAVEAPKADAAPAPEKPAAPALPTALAAKGVGKLEVHGSLIPRLSLAHDEDRALEDQAGFTLARGTMSLQGEVEKAPLSFELEVNFKQTRDAAAAAEFPVTYAWVDFAPIEDRLTLRLGAYKVPFNRSYMISHTRLAFADTAHFVSTMKLDQAYQLGAMASGSIGEERVLWWASVNNGSMPGKTGVFPQRAVNAGNVDENLLTTLRLDVNVLGTKDFRKQAFREGAPDVKAPPLLAIGLAGTHEQIGEKESEITVTRQTADLLYRRHGVSFEVEGVREEVTAKELGGDHLGLRWGAFAQLGFNLEAHVDGLPLEPVVRAEASRERLAPVDIELERRAFLGGLNWYFAGHDAKLQADFTWNQKRDDPEAEPASLARLQLVVRM